MKRVICLWLPNWPITRLSLTSPDCAAPDKPLAIVATKGSKRRVWTVNRIAYERGVCLNQRLADAQAIAPDLVTIAADPEADNAALAALSRWAQRFTPSCAVNAPGGLWLDITGCARLWRSERLLVETLIEQLSARGIPCRAAVADTFGAAWAFARQTDRYHILPPGEHRNLLPDLPLAALRLGAETQASLRRLGLTTIRQVMETPRARLAHRFDDLLMRLDQAMGDIPEAIAFEHAPSPWFESAAFPDALTAHADLRRVLGMMTARLCARLAETGRGARRFEMSFFGADNSIQRIAVATPAASADAKGVGRLLEAELAGIDPGFGIEVVTLRASRVERPVKREARTRRAGRNVVELAPFLEAVGRRLGLENVWRLAPREGQGAGRAAQQTASLDGDAVGLDPSRITAAISFDGSERDFSGKPLRTSPHPALAEPDKHVWQEGWTRPVRLLSRPEPIQVVATVPDSIPHQFRWRRIVRRVRRAEGPECAAPEWLSESGDRQIAQARGYYRVEDESGARYWIYRDGGYADAGGPRWYIHGFLA